MAVFFTASGNRLRQRYVIEQTNRVLSMLIENFSLFTFGRCRLCNTLNIKRILSLLSCVYIWLMTTKSVQRRFGKKFIDLVSEVLATSDELL